MFRTRWQHLAIVAMLALMPAALAAQGRVVGTITGSRGQPLSDARVSLQGTRYSTATQRDGRYSIAGVPAGTYTVDIRAVGHTPSQTRGIVVAATGVSTVNATLEAAAVQLTGLVVSASRQLEKVTDAPATVSRIEASEIENSVGNSFSGALKKVIGIDFIQVGVTGAAINARGFNSSFNNRMLQLEDGRISVIGEAGLPLGSLTALSKVDLAGIEVVVGPGSALYGADASNGVVTLQTKDPRQYPGLTLEVAGGNRGYQNLQGRFAGVKGDWGYKVTGEYQKADDFEKRLNFGTAPNVRPDTFADFTSRVARGTGALVRYMGASRFELTGGYSTTDGIGPTNLGRNQLIDYSHNFQQAKFVSPRWYATAYRTATNAGKTFQLNAFTTNRAVFPASVSDDSVRNLASFPGGSSILYGELQHNMTLPALLSTKLIVGGQIRHDDVDSRRRWLEDRVTRSNVKLNQQGVYLQTETPFSSKLRLVLAGRYDKATDYKAQFSPKAALLFSPTPNHTFRASINRAYKNPTILQGYFSAANFAVVVPGALYVGAFGNRFGFTFKDAAGTVKSTVDPLVPESNTTYELGWKGILRSNLFFDVTGYSGKYKHFFTPLIPLHGLPLGAAATYGFVNGKEVLGPNNEKQWIFGYKNVGDATIRGLDLGARWLPSPKVAINGTLSRIALTKLDTTGTGTAGREATSLNSSPTHLAVGVDLLEPVKNLLVGLTARSSDEYFFRSGVNVGVVPKFQTADVYVGYKLGSSGVQLNANVSNLFSCSGGSYALGPTQANPGTFTRDRKCGFGQKHMEMINMAEIGTVVFVGVRIQR